MARVIILSGAGLSAESGISTFRDDNGLWENHRIEDVCLKGCLETNRNITIDFYDMLRTNLKDKEPNHAHRVISELKIKYPNDIAVITQNIDDLFEKANCPNVLHLHGFLKELRCESCDEVLNINYEIQSENYHTCSKCNNKLRPNIVFFGEKTPKYDDLNNELLDCEVLIVIGTSGAVINTDMFLNENMKLTILNNLEPSAYLYHQLYTKAIFEPATKAIDEIAKDIEKYIKNKE